MRRLRDAGPPCRALRARRGARRRDIARCLRRPADRHGLTIAVRGRPGRFEYVRELVRARRIVLELWKAAPPRAAAVVRRDGCLALDGVGAAPARVDARGRALRKLAPGSPYVTLRDARGAVLELEETLVGAGGRWTQSGRYRGERRQAGTLEAVVLSSRDGSIDCIVQDRVTLRP